MAFDRYRATILVRLLLLAVTLNGMAGLIWIAHYYISASLVAVIVILQGVELARHAERHSRDTARFLAAVRQGDVSQRFPDLDQSPAFREMRTAFERIQAEMRLSREEREVEHRYLQTVLQHVGIGLIVMNPGGEVEMINNAARRLLGTPRLREVGTLAALSPDLADALLHIRSGERRLVKVLREDRVLQLAVAATEVRRLDRRRILVSLQDIGVELEETEMEAWQKLTRVLTHEIMNSVTPIASLAGTAAGLVDSLDGDGGETVRDIGEALQVIRKRSEGLVSFVDAYRRLTRVPQPDFQLCRVDDLLERVTRLMHPVLETEGVECLTEIRPANLVITADPALVEQVLINLLQNAVQALQGGRDPRIRLTAEIDEESRVQIRVADNGPGIESSVLERIFIPFFTTRPHGSGIGLSLSRQIMRLHRGSITVRSDPAAGTTFTLHF